MNAQLFFAGSRWIHSSHVYPGRCIGGWTAVPRTFRCFSSKIGDGTINPIGTAASSPCLFPSKHLVFTPPIPARDFHTSHSIARCSHHSNCRWPAGRVEGLRFCYTNLSYQLNAIGASQDSSHQQSEPHLPHLGFRFVWVDLGDTFGQE